MHGVIPPQPFKLSQTSSPLDTGGQDGVNIEDLQHARDRLAITQFKGRPSGSTDTKTTARDLTLEAARDANSSRKVRRHISPAQLKALLESRKDAEVIEGLRRVLAVCYPMSL